jgi:hypothetical protein
MGASGGAGFSLWGLVLARPKIHRMKPAALEPIDFSSTHAKTEQYCCRIRPSIIACEYQEEP